MRARARWLHLPVPDIKVLIRAVDTSSLSESWSDHQLTSDQIHQALHGLPGAALFLPVELPGLSRYLPVDPKFVKHQPVVMAVAEAMMPVLTSFPSPFEGKHFDNVSD